MVLALLVAAAIMAAGWRFSRRQPSDISESEAQDKAQSALEDFCLSEKIICPDFALAGHAPPTNNSFHWAFHYENPHADPGQKIVVSVDKKGNFTLEMTTLPPSPDGGSSPPPP